MGFAATNITWTRRWRMAEVQSITRSARSMMDRGTTTPSALAVLRFSTISTTLGCSIGISAGLAPVTY